MPLKSVKEAVFTVEYSDFDDFVSHEYGRQYNCCAMGEFNNDSCYKYFVEKDLSDPHIQEDLDAAREKGVFSVSIPTILTDLCNRNLIEPGTYLIEVCW